MRRGLKFLAVAGIISLITTACTVTFLPEEADSDSSRNSSTSRTVSPKPVARPDRPNVPDFPHDEILTYNCDGGRLLVRYTSNDSAEVFADGWQELTRTTSRDGWFVYKDSRHEWYAQRSQGLLRRDGSDLMTGCRL